VEWIIRANNSLPEWSKEEILQEGSAFLAGTKCQQPKRYLENPNPVELAEFERSTARR